LESEAPLHFDIASTAKSRDHTFQRTASMKHTLQNPLIERGPIRFVGTRGFFFCFAAVTVAAFVAGFLRPGIAIFALPLLAWSPFLLLISLHTASHAIRQTRDSGAPTAHGATRAQLKFGIVIDLVAIAAYVFMFLRSGHANLLAVNWLSCLPILIIVNLDLASNILAYTRNPWRPILRRAIPPVSWFCMAIFLAVFALWMLCTIRAPQP
jgi:hypothetical protein